MIGDPAENSSEQAPAPLCEWLCRTSAVVAAFAGPLAVGAVTTGVAIATSHETISENGVVARVEPDLNGKITLDIGPLAFRVPLDDLTKGLGPFSATVGGTVSIQGADATTSVRVSAADAPDAVTNGFVRTQESLKNQYSRALFLGVLSMFMTGSAIEVARRTKGVNPVWPGAVAVVASAGLAGASLPAVSSSQFEDAQWRPALSYIPAAQKKAVNEVLPEIAQKIEIRGGNDQARDRVAELVDNAITRPLKYWEERSKEFAEKIPNVLPAKKPGEERVLVIADLHGNVIMTELLQTMIRSTEVDTIVFTGDNGPGSPFDHRLLGPMLNSLEEIGVTIVYVTGNHDIPAGNKAFELAGAKELNGKPMKVGGLWLYGGRDNTETPLGRGTEEKWPTDENSQRLSDGACGFDQAKTINAAFFHRPEVAKQTGANGCAQIVVSGHTHTQIDPVLTEGNGTRIYRMWSGTSAGAKDVLTFGYPQVQADLTLLAFDEGELSGWQRYTIPRPIKEPIQLTPFNSVKPTRTYHELQRALLQGALLRNIPIGS